MPMTTSGVKARTKLPMTDAQLAAWEASRDLDAELLESVRQFKRGEGRVAYPPSAIKQSDAGATSLEPDAA